MSDIIDKEPVPAGGNVNKPSSGTYGEKASVERLKSQLPQVQPGPLGGGGPAGGQGGQGLTSPPGPGPRPQPTEQSPIPGIPAPIFDQTDRPNVDVNTPLVEGNAGPATPSQGALRVIDSLRQDPDPEVQEFAEMLFEFLLQASTEQ